MNILKKHIVLFVFSFFIVSCSNEEKPPVNNGNRSDVSADVADIVIKDVSADIKTSLDSGTDIGTDTGQTLIGGCTVADPASCAYKPEKRFQIGGKTTRSVVYTDITGAQRTVNIEIRRPMGAPRFHVVFTTRT